MIAFITCMIVFAIAQKIYLIKNPESEYISSSKYFGSGVNDFDGYYCGGEA